MRNVFQLSPLFAGLFPAESGMILFSPPRGATQLSWERIPLHRFCTVSGLPSSRLILISTSSGIMSRKETIDHCFLNCVRVKRVWSFFSPVLSSLLGNVFLPSCTRVFFEGMIRHILSDIKNRVACDYYRLTFSDFKNCWEAPGLCRLNGDSYKLLL